MYVDVKLNELEREQEGWLIRTPVGFEFHPMRPTLSTYKTTYRVWGSDSMPYLVWVHGLMTLQYRWDASWEEGHEDMNINELQNYEL